MIKIDSFQELAIEVNRQSDGHCKVTLREERRVEIETTSSIFSTMFGDESLNPETILLQAEVE